MDSSLTIKYISNFRKFISNYLREGVGLEIDIYNCSDGAVLNVRFVSNSFSTDKEIRSFDKIYQALNHVKQKFFGGTLTDGIKFGGTNIMMDEGRILIIKDSVPEEWSYDKARQDVSQIIHPPKRSMI